MLGIEDDEALFAAPYLPPRSDYYGVQIGHSRYPLMVMSYIGTLKSWLYRPLLRRLPPGVWTTREPMLLAGAASIWIFYLLLRRTAGERAAVLGSLLLAVNSTYLLTSVFDWGPVVLQHLLLLAAVYLLVRFAQDLHARSLAGGFFLLGLALWDKAIAVWVISGMAVAAAGLFPRRIVELITGRRIAVAALAFCLGALPFLVFNIARPGETFSGISRDTSGVPGKVQVLLNTLQGRGLFGYLTEEDWRTPRPHAPAGVAGRAAAVSSAAGHPRDNLMLYALALALALSLLGGPKERRIILFAVLAMAIAWIQMALTVNAGGSVHHTILLWPLPEALIAVSFAAASRRIGRGGLPALAAVAVVLIVSNGLVTNEYFVMMSRNGGSVSWSDAIFPLTARVQAMRPYYVFCADWGILDSLRLVSGGKLTLFDATGAIAKPAVLRRMLDLQGHLFIASPAEMEVFRGNREKLLSLAAEYGYRQERLGVVEDTFGRPTFEIMRFHPRP